MAAGIKLAPLMTEIKVDIGNFKNDMNKAASVGVNEAKRISKELSTTAKVGDILSNAGSTLTKGITLPLVGAGVAATKMAVDFESNFAKVSTLLDSNVVDFDTYKNDLLNASSDSKIAVGEFSEAVYESISAGVDQTKAIGFTKDAMKLAKGGFTDGAKAVDVLTTAINGYNLKSEDATRISDLLITTQNLGKTTVDELANSMGTVIPMASSVNFGINELSAAYAQLTKNGIATAESGTYLKAMLSELGKSGSITDTTLRELTGKGFAQLKLEGTSTADILNLLSDAAENDGKTLKDMFGSVEAGSAALVLAKGDGAEYNEMLNGMATSAGATQDAFEKMDATPAEQLKGALNELKNDAIKFGGAFVPVIEKVSDVLGDAADAFSGLSEEQQQSVIKWGMVLAATGPVLKVASGCIGVYTSLASVMGGASKAAGVFGSAQKAAATAAKGTSAIVGSSGLTGSLTGLLGICAPVALGVAAVGTGLYAIHESGQLAKRSVTDASEEMSLMERVIAKLSGTEVYSREELEKMGYVHKEFSEDISPQFQKEVEKSTKKVQDFNVFLQEMGFDNVVTQEESDEFTKRVNDTCDEAVKAIQNKKDESQAALKGLFTADDNVIDESEQRVLEILSQSSDKQIGQVQTLQGEILAINQKAVDEKRALNEQEIADIEAKNAQIRQIELEALGGTQEEIMYAKNEFSARAENLDVDNASKLLKSKAKARDDEIVKVKASYDTEIELLKSHLGEENGVNDAALQEQITNLEADKQTKIQQQEDLYNEYLAIIEKNNPKLLDAIDSFNGKVLTQEDMKCASQLAMIESQYEGIASITESGMYRVKNTTDNKWHEIYATVDKTTGEIVGIHDYMVDETFGATSAMSENTKNAANSMKISYQGVEYEIGQLQFKNGNLVNSNGDVVASLQNVKEATDGTRTGIVNINGTPYNITVNKEGTIQSLQEINNKADETAKPRTIRFSIVATGGDMASKVAQAGRDAVADIIGSRQFNGLDNVPYDGYRAVLHKGERVMTAQENKSYTDAAYNDNSPKSITAIFQIQGKEIKREIIPLVNEGLGALSGRRTR